MPPKPPKDSEVAAYQRAVDDPLLETVIHEYADFPRGDFISGRAAYLAYKQAEILSGKPVEVVRRLGDMGMLVAFYNYGVPVGIIEDAPHFHGGQLSGYPYFRTYVLMAEGDLRLTHKRNAAYSSAVRRLERLPRGIRN